MGGRTTFEREGVPVGESGSTLEPWEDVGGGVGGTAFEREDVAVREGGSTLEPWEGGSTLEPWEGVGDGVAGTAFEREGVAVEVGGSAFEPRESVAGAGSTPELDTLEGAGGSGAGPAVSEPPRDLEFWSKQLKGLFLKKSLNSDKKRRTKDLLSKIYHRLLDIAKPLTVKGRPNLGN